MHFGKSIERLICLYDNYFLGYIYSFTKHYCDQFKVLLCFLLVLELII